MDGGGGGAGRAAGRLCPPPYRPACVTKETQGVWAVDPSTEEQPALPEVSGSTGQVPTPEPCPPLLTRSPRPGVPSPRGP